MLRAYAPLRRSDGRFSGVCEMPAGYFTWQARAP
jgi:hypothetical protein